MAIRARMANLTIVSLWLAMASPAPAIASSSAMVSVCSSLTKASFFSGDATSPLFHSGLPWLVQLLGMTLGACGNYDIGRTNISGIFMVS
ncbi:MAG: hypothetical protein F6J90_34765 [Moorea sp. SIOASIH]|uniref:hypothetical protein n=1 Tax=Moorena sp. SIOASIH TaxID=2607817 RepID=UPI0013B7150F|nr:hypothetical protein [Moorena sp. SIOASIH]NEO41213.1 hypothetical protein [Moorena sp. SIOASIH]